MKNILNNKRKANSKSNKIMSINRFVSLETVLQHHNENQIDMKKYPLCQTTSNLDSFLSIPKRKKHKKKSKSIQQVSTKINAVKAVFIV